MQHYRCTCIVFKIRNVRVRREHFEFIRAIIRDKKSVSADMRGAASSGLEVELNSGKRKKAECVSSVNDRVAEKPLAV